VLLAGYVYLNCWKVRYTYILAQEQLKEENRESVQKFNLSSFPLHIKFITS
jgi:hypothetical protein